MSVGPGPVGLELGIKFDVKHAAVKTLKNLLSRFLFFFNFLCCFHLQIMPLSDGNS